MGRVFSAVRRAAVFKGFSQKEVDKRLAAIEIGRTSIIEHILNAHRDNLRAAAENLRGPLAEIASAVIQLTAADVPSLKAGKVSRGGGD